MTTIESKKVLIARNLILVLLTLQFSSCIGQVKEKYINDTIENEDNTQPLILKQSTTFPQIHTNLNGMVREFVRTMYQDKKGIIGLEQMEMGLSGMMGKHFKKFQSKDFAH